MPSPPGLGFDLAGPPSGDPLVFVHGLAGDRTQLSDLIRHLEPRYRTLNIDLPGHGDSRDVAVTSIAGLASSIAPLVAKTFPGPVTLVGHSMGASVCLEVAALLRGKVRHVIALDALYQAILYPRRSRIAAFLMGAVLAGAYRPAMKALLRPLFVAETPDVVRRRVVATALATSKAASSRLLASLARWDRDHALAATDVPVTIIAAESWAKHAELSVLSPRCRLVRFARGGHYFPSEFPKESAEQICQALRENRGSRSKPSSYRNSP